PAGLPRWRRTGCRSAALARRRGPCPCEPRYQGGRYWTNFSALLARLPPQWFSDEDRLLRSATRGVAPAPGGIRPLGRGAVAGRGAGSLASDTAARRGQGARFLERSGGWRRLSSARAAPGRSAAELVLDAAPARALAAAATPGELRRAPVALAQTSRTRSLFRRHRCRRFNNWGDLASAGGRVRHRRDHCDRIARRWRTQRLAASARLGPAQSEAAAECRSDRPAR